MRRLGSHAARRMSWWWISIPIAAIVLVAFGAILVINRPPNLPIPVPPASAQETTAAVDAACAGYGSANEAGPATVRILGPERAGESELLARAWAAFEGCTEIDIEFIGAPDLTAALEAGTAPDADLLMLPGPRSLGALVASGAVVPAPDEVVANVERGWSSPWIQYGSIDGTLYAAPWRSSVNSLVWFSPTWFLERGLSVPATWDDLFDLSDDLAAAGTKPWCGGIAAGSATGWPAGNWLAELVLRMYGGNLYDQWVTNTLPFDSPQIAGAMEVLESWMRNPDYVNGGFGDAATVATTDVDTVGTALLSGECAMLQQGAAYAVTWQVLAPGTTIAPDGDIYAFVLPEMSPQIRVPIVGESEFVVARNGEPAVRAVQALLSSAEFASERAALGGWVSANTAVDPDRYVDPLDRLQAQALTDPATTFRISAAELMPVQVGWGAFWTQLAAWFADEVTLDEALQAIDAAWPVE